MRGPQAGGDVSWVDRIGALWLLNGIIANNSTMYFWKYTHN
jgi:hypothetical protein